jgi:hypothetical protein
MQMRKLPKPLPRIHSDTAIHVRLDRTLDLCFDVGHTRRFFLQRAKLHIRRWGVELPTWSFPPPGSYQPGYELVRLNSNINIDIFECEYKTNILGSYFYSDIYSIQLKMHSVKFNIQE